MKTTKLFQSNRSQAVRIPKAFAFGRSVQQVNIIQQGNGLLIVPDENVWDDFFDQSGSPDFMAEGREQPAMQERDSF